MKIPNVDRNDVIPLYAQIKRIFIDKIVSGELKLGEKIPSELTLSDKFGTSRMTVRQAMTELENEGFLVRNQGRGTFVGVPKITLQLSSITSFTEDMATKAKKASSVVLKQEIVPLDDSQVASFFPFTQHIDRAFLLERLRLADGEIFALERCLLYFPGCEELSKVEFSNRSLYDTLIEDYDLIPTKAYQEIEAALVDEEIAKLLGIQRPSAVLITRRRSFDQNEKNFEYTSSFYRSDKYIFRAELSSRSFLKSKSPQG